jgi:DNA ligase-1
MAKGTKARQAIVLGIMATLGPLEAKYFVKLLGGELRIGLKEAQVEEALAKSFARPLDDIRRANLLRGDIGEVAVAARYDTLGEARLALFHPLGFMLAQPLESAAEIVEALPAPFAAEDKYDGIRAQIHIGTRHTGDHRVAIFSRTLDDITSGYPDVVAAASALGDGLVLDGELLAADPDDPLQARPFKTFQQRLGRKSPTEEMLREIPATFVAFDMLAQEHQLIVDLPYTDRRARLAQLPWPARGARLAPMQLIEQTAQLDAAFEQARAHGNEGMIAKRLDAPYTPGRRGGVWYKLKRALATLDVVITGAERGHGRRRHVLSDYTFAVRASAHDPTLLNVGKAYNGLTDAEIVELTKRLEAITEERHGAFHKVTPTIVLEVTFDIVQRSARHKAGYALRFPRIVRIRDDKPAEEIDTLARVKELAGDA